MRVQDHDDLLEMVGLDFEAAWTLQNERPPGRPTGLYGKLIAISTNVCVNFIVGVTDHVQDHFLAYSYVDLFPIRSGLSLDDDDVDGECVVRVQ